MSNILETVDKILDPFNLLGLRGTEADKIALKLQKAKEKYSRLWREGSNKGYPMELLGYPKPEAILLSAGIGGAPSDPIGIPSLIPPSTASLQQQIQHTEEEVKEQEDVNARLYRELEAFERETEAFSEIESDIRENILRKERIERGEETKEEKEIKEEKEEIGDVKQYYIRPKEAYRRKKLKEKGVSKNQLIGRTIIVKIFELLTAQKRSLINSIIDNRGLRLQKEKISLIRRILSDENVSQEIVDVFTNSEINLEGLTNAEDALQVVNQIMSRTGIEALLLVNDILEIFHRNAQNSIRFTNEEVEYFKQLDTSNLLQADVDAEIRFPNAIPGLFNRILETIVDADVDRNIARRFTIRLMNRIMVMTDYFIDTMGGQDVGLAKANEYLGLVIDDVVKELGKEKMKVKLNIPKLKDFFIETIKTTPKAILDYAGKLKSDKYKVIKTLIKEIITPAQGSRLPPMRSIEAESIRDDLDRNIDAIIPRERNVREWLFEDEANSDSSSDDSLIAFTGEPGIPQAELYEPLPTGNLVINSSRLGAQLIMRWNNENRLIGWRDYGIYLEDSARITPGGDPNEAFYLLGGGGDPGGDPDDPRRGFDIVIETPRGSRRIGFKNFIRALVIVGLTSSSIAGIVEGLKSATKNNKKSLNFGEDKNKKIDITIKDKPRTEQDMYKKLAPNEPPSRSVSTNLRTGGANRLGITEQIREFGLEDNVNQYNEIVAKFNKAIQHRDKSLVEQYKKELDEAWKPINDKFVLQDRAVKPFEMPDPESTLDLSSIQPDRIKYGRQEPLGKGNLIRSPLPGEQLNYLVATDEQIADGLEDVIGLANGYIRSFNDYSIRGDTTNMMKFHGKLNNLSRWVALPRYKPQEKAKEEDYRVGDVEQELVDNVEQFNQLKKSGADEQQLRLKALKIQELRSTYINLKTKAGEGVKFETYLPDNLIKQEAFPKTPEQTFKFNELQRLEKLLLEHVNPNDIDNKAKREYASYVGTIYGEGTTDPMKFYQDRIDKIKERLRANKIDEHIIEDFERNEERHRQEATGDDPDSDITIQGAQTIETITPQEREEGDLRPSFKTGGEAHLLVSTPDEMEEENKRWREYSLVRPGFGNGGVKDNSLFRHSMREEQLRFMPLRSVPAEHQPPMPAPHHPSRQSQFTNIYQINDRFLPINHHGNELFGFTPERLTSTEWNEFENNRNGYMPEHVLARHRDKPTRILGLRPDGQRFTPYSYTYAEAIKPTDYHHQGGRVMDEDIPYENAKGFRIYQPEDNHSYERAIKKHY